MEERPSAAEMRTRFAASASRSRSQSFLARELSVGHQKSKLRQLESTFPLRAVKKQDSSSAEETRVVDDLIYASEYGDIPSVTQILSEFGEEIEQGKIDIGRRDVFHRNAILIAANNEHAEIVEMLLDYSEPADIYESLLSAINWDYPNIAETILHHKKFTPFCGKTIQLARQLPETSMFWEDQTPLILACQKNQFGTVNLLLKEKWEELYDPHKVNCPCKDCKQQPVDQLREARKRLNLYKALTSEAYISLHPLHGRDPILRAFLLTRDVRERAIHEKHFQAEYRQLEKNLNDYVVKLLDCVRSQDELNVILNRNCPATSDLPNQKPLALLNLALLFEHKKFVAHWTSQQELIRLWFDGFQHTDNKINWVRWALILLLYPILLVIYWCAPNSKYGKIVKRPLVKFTAFTMCYMSFLVLIVAGTLSATGPYSSYGNISALDSSGHFGGTVNATGSIYKNYKKFCKDVITTFNGTRKIGMLDACPRDFTVRPHGDNWIGITLTIYIIGFILNKVRFFYMQRSLGRILCSPYDWIDISMLCLSFTAIALRMSAHFKILNALSYLSQDKNWQLNNLNGTDKGTLFEQEAYWITSDRYYFHPLDNALLSEILFGFAAVLAFSRLMYIFPSLELFGPMYISLLRVLKDILSFFFIFMVVFLAFMVGITNVYWYFQDVVQDEIDALHRDDLKESMVTARFGNIELTFRTVFWALFGLGESDYMTLTYGDSMVWVERAGYIIYGAYNITVVAVLLNMLVAMMAKSYEEVKMNSDQEWKFTRTKLFMEYVQDRCTVPVPFNLVPNPRSLRKLYVLCAERCCPEKADVVGEVSSFTDSCEESVFSPPTSPSATIPLHKTKKNSGTNGDSVEAGKRTVSTSDKVEDQRYQKVITKIKERFILNYFNKMSSTVNLEELKQDISSFRYEVLNVLIPADRRQSHARRRSIHTPALSRQTEKSENKHGNVEVEQISAEMRRVRSDLDRILSLLARPSLSDDSTAEVALDRAGSPQPRLVAASTPHTVDTLPRRGDVVSAVTKC